MCMRYVFIYSFYDIKDMKVYGFLDINYCKYCFLGGFKNVLKVIDNDIIYNFNWL